jgi:branched-chain amino acid transport system permease protein
MKAIKIKQEADMLGNFAGVLFDGIAYGSLLFLISVGLSVTMGMMNFINLAHGAFAMLGGYVCVTVLSRSACRSWPRCRWPSSPRPLVGLVLERTLYRRCTRPATWTRCCSRSA